MWRVISLASLLVSVVIPVLSLLIVFVFPDCSALKTLQTVCVIALVISLLVILFFGDSVFHPH